MTGMLRLQGMALLALLAVALATSVAAVRPGLIAVPPLPFLDRPSAPTGPQDVTPAQVPVRVVESPAAEPASGPAMNSAPVVNPESTVNTPVSDESVGVGSDIGSPSTLTTTEATNTKVHPVTPSRFADGEPTIGPVRLRGAPAPTSPKQPQRPGTGN